VLEERQLQLTPTMRWINVTLLADAVRHEATLTRLVADHKVSKRLVVLPDSYEWMLIGFDAAPDTTLVL